MKYKVPQAAIFFMTSFNRKLYPPPPGFAPDLFTFVQDSRLHYKSYLGKKDLYLKPEGIPFLELNSRSFRCRGYKGVVGTPQSPSGWKLVLKGTRQCLGEGSGATHENLCTQVISQWDSTRLSH